MKLLQDWVKGHNSRTERFRSTDPAESDKDEMRVSSLVSGLVSRIGFMEVLTRKISVWEAMDYHKVFKGINIIFHNWIFLFVMNHDNHLQKKHFFKQQHLQHHKLHHTLHPKLLSKTNNSKSILYISLDINKSKTR